MPPTLSLTTASRACAQAFTQLCALLEDPQREKLSGLTQSAIEDECGRFRIWAGNLGALQQLPNPTSLDHRSRQSLKIACHIHELLETLKDSLQDIYAIASGARVNRQASLPEDDEEEGELDELDNISDSNETRGELSKLFEAQEIFESAKETITSLFRLSIIIRKASPRDRFAKALAARQNPFDEQFDISHVGREFPLLEIKENQWLKERLGRAITQRRQFLRYAHEHRNNIGKEPNDIWAPEDQEDSKEQLLSVDWGGEDRKSKTALTNRSGAASIPAPTNASTLLPSALENMEEDFHDDISQTSYAMSMGDDIDDGKLHLPRLADVAKGVSPFECPLCWTIQDLKEESSWRKHAFGDLRPYICTFEKCDVKLFSDSRDWFEHELQFHRTQWRCGFCVREPYHTLYQFQKHLQEQHTQNLTEEQLQAVCEASQQPVDRISVSDCPFCKDWEIKLRRENPNIPIDETTVVSPAQFRHHVGSHMQQLALFAIPRGYLEKETVDVNSAASVAVAGAAARDFSKPRSALGSFKTYTASAYSYPSSVSMPLNVLKSGSNRCPPYYFRIDYMQEHPSHKPFVDAVGTWHPPKSLGMNQLIGGGDSGRYWYCDGCSISRVDSLPNGCSPFKTFSVYYHTGIFWAFRSDASTAQVGDGDDDTRGQDSENALEGEDWYPLSFDYDDEYYSSYITNAGQNSRLRTQRPDQTWPGMLLPEHYHALGSSYISAELTQYGGLTGELPLFLALVAFSVDASHVGWALQTCFKDQSWRTHYCIHGRKNGRGMVVRVYCPPGRDDTELTSYENGKFGKYFY